MSRVSSSFRNLQDAVIRHSEADEWYSAVNEWTINDVEEDETLTESCVCGKEKLHYLFTIRNKLNGNILCPIGSSCIKKFERDDLDEEVDLKVQLFELLHAIEKDEYIVLSSDFFSRKLRQSQNTCIVDTNSIECSKSENSVKRGEHKVVQDITYDEVSCIFFANQIWSGEDEFRWYRWCWEVLGKNGLTRYSSPDFLVARLDS